MSALMAATTFAIYRAGAPLSEWRRVYNQSLFGAPGREPQPRRMQAGVPGSAPKEALGQFVHDRYLVTAHRQYGGHVFEWHGDRAWGQWRQDDGKDARGRRWSVVVTLCNGAAVHTARFYAVKEPS